MKRESLHLTLDNSKSDEKLGDYQDKMKRYSRQEEFEFLNGNFAEKGVLRVLLFLKCPQTFYGVQFFTYSSY